MRRLKLLIPPNKDSSAGARCFKALCGLAGLLVWTGSATAAPINVMDVSLVDSRHGAALVDRCQRVPCRRVWVSVTNDGGRTFQRWPVPGHGAPRRVDLAPGGLLYVQRGSRIYRSYRSGQGWARIGPRHVLAWTARETGAWALSQHCAAKRHCSPPRLWHSFDAGRTWYFRTLANGDRGQAIKPSYSLSFADAADGLVIYPTVDGHEILGITHNGGHTWSFRPTPCAGQYYRAGIADDSTWIGCAGDPGTGFQAKELYRSLDTGQHFRLELKAPFLKLNKTGKGVSYVGYLDYFTPVSASSAYAFIYRVGLVRTADGGHHWISASRAVNWGDRTGLTNTAVTPDGTTAWQGVLNIGLYASHDRGGHWRRLRP